MTKLLNRLAMLSAISSVGVALFGLFFRGVLYGRISSTTATISAHLIIYGVFLLALVAMVLGVLLFMVPAWRNLRLATSVLVTSLVTPPIFYVLYTLLAKGVG